MNSLDIVNLIDKNSITRLSKNYDNKLINKIKTSFTDNQQQLFVASFYCYLNYDTKKDFVIDFDNVWKWLGYNRKGDGKRVLERNFVADIDYKVEKTASATSEAVFEDVEKAAPVTSKPKPTSPDTKINGGQNKERILLSVNTFKKFCMKANTRKSDEVHEYYIKLEELLQETVNEQTDELRLQLQEKNEESNELNLQLEVKQVLLDNKDKQIKTLEKKVVMKQGYSPDKKLIIYILSSKVHIKDRIYIFGKTVRKNSRLSAYNKTIEHDVLYFREFKNVNQLIVAEKMVLYKLDKYREQANRDRFILPEDKDISFFTSIIDEAVLWFQNVADDVVIDETEEQKLVHKHMRGQQYDEENADRLKEYQDGRKPEKQEYDKNHYQENKEKKLAQVAEYQENNRDKIKETKHNSYEKNKEEILKGQKKYYEDNKQHVSDRNKESIVCTCGLTIKKSSKYHHLKTDKHKKLIESIDNNLLE